MKAWEELTERGRFRRLRSLALTALAHYEIEPIRLAFVGGFTNAIYRVDTAGAPLALRIDYLEDHPDSSTDVEMAWIQALAAETDIDVCQIVPTRDGNPYTHAGATGVPGERRCSLFEWIPGKPLHDDLRPERFHQLGTVAAQLHLHGAHFEPPHRPMAWDRIFYWPEELDPVVYASPEHAHHFAGGRRELLQRAIETVGPAFDKLDPVKAQVIHADLHPWNVHVKGRRMIVFDFEDVAWGHRVQDVAITLFYERDHPDYADLRAAFTDGYSAIAPWPESYPGEIEHFMAARTIMFVNFVLNIGSDIGEYFPAFFSRLERFLEAWA